MSEIKNIDANQLKDWLNSGEALLVDVREPNEFTEWRIPRAISMPLTNIEKHLPNLEGEKRKVVFQCLKGKRGEMGALAAIEKFGTNNLDVYNLTGGIEAWDAAGGTITRDSEKGSSKLPIIRQVHITVGAAVLLSSLLAIAGVGFASYIAAFFGAGLLFAGLTGWCGMAMLLQKMPWNK